MVSCGARVVTGADETSLNGSPKLLVRAAVAMFRKSRRSATGSVVAVTVNRRSKTEGPEGVNAGVLKFKEFCAGSTLKLKLGRRGTSVSSGPRPNRPGGGMEPPELGPTTSAALNSGRGRKSTSIGVSNVVAESSILSRKVTVSPAPTRSGFGSVVLPLKAKTDFPNGWGDTTRIVVSLLSAGERSPPPTTCVVRLTELSMGSPSSRSGVPDTGPLKAASTVVWNVIVAVVAPWPITPSAAISPARMPSRPASVSTRDRSSVTAV